ncbi:MAG TPA: hypothetical protein EYM84_00180, partial [Flavobacteriales bacterium]|nr:hypothetical protein [Flavobacteriales bacterium]
MKKKYYYPSILITVFAFLLCSLTTNAQTTVFSEDFNSIMPGMSITKATSDLTLYGLSPLMRYSQVNNGRFRAGDAVSNTSKCNSTYGPTASLGGYIILDCSANGTYSANVLTIGPLSMAAYQGGSAEMTFYCADIGDEFHYNYTWGIYKMDQVAISYDGGSTFYFVQTSGGTGYSGNTKGTNAWINPVKAGLSAANQYFTQYTFSISAHAAAFGQTLNDNIVIQLAQYDNYKSTSCTASDGLGFDDIVITGTAAGGPPATPGTITGSATPYASWVGETYSITAVGGADSYAWTVPSGWSITSGQGHTSITVTTGTGNGNISVTATNNHGISAASTLAVAPIPGATLPYTATFDNEATHSGTAGVQGFTFATPGWTNVTNGSGDDIDWRIYTGSTGSGNTGPTTGDGGSGKYMYIESSSPNYNVAAILISRAIDLSSYAAADLSFAYHMYGAAIGTMVVDVSSNGGSTWTTEWTMSGNQGNAWANATVSLNSYAGSLIYIRIKGTTGSTFTSDFAIDSWSVEEGCSFSVGSLSSGSPESLSSITATTTIGLTGQSSSASIQWQNTTGGGSSWSNCNNSSATSSSYTTGWIGKDMDYRAALRVGSEACYSSTYSLTQSNAGHVWTGGNNYIYHTASNWSEASLPTASTSVYIGTENYGSAPSITTTASYANDLEIQAGATLGNIAASGGGLTVSGSVNVAGTITNNGAGAIKVTGGSISGGTKVEAGAHASDYTYTFTRGYYFQAQSSFTISGVHASDGNTAGSAANSQSV